METLQCLLQDLRIDEIFSATQQQELRKFYDIIDTFCEKHTWPDSAQIQDMLDQTYIALNEGIELQVITIHKSKGLEFDWVIIPNMGDSNKPSTPNWFEWIPLSNHKFSLPAFCLSAHDEYVNLFKWYENQHSIHENQRLCYVGLTRAKFRLYLFDDKEKPQKNSFRTLFPTDFFTFKENVVSLKLLESAGYQREGLLRNKISRDDGRQVDMYIYAALPEDWEYLPE
jgi:ATP-dependent exoDNAse (exonuclease V) beta subunit